MGPLAIMAVTGAIGGLSKIAMGIQGRGARKAELTKAQGEYDTENLTVNQQQAQFQNQMFQQAQANTLQGLQRSAGGSGVASLAQALSNQSMMQSQAASASIGAQESANQLAIAKGGMMEQQMELQAQTVYGKGSSEQQRLEMSRQSTLLGMGANRLGAARQDIATHKAMIAGGVGELAGAVATGYAGGYDSATGGFSKKKFLS